MPRMDLGVCGWSMEEQVWDMHVKCLACQNFSIEKSVVGRAEGATLIDDVGIPKYVGEARQAFIYHYFLGCDLAQLGT